MIYYNYETDFSIDNEVLFSNWLELVILSEAKQLGEISYIFCDNEYLNKVNIEFLNHDTYTDIITFDYSLGNEVIADIYISVDMVKENAREYSESFETELLRVMSHGILHCCGYKDKSEKESLLMRSKEDEKIKLFHVEHKV